MSQYRMLLTKKRTYEIDGTAMRQKFDSEWEAFLLDGPEEPFTEAAFVTEMCNEIGHEQFEDYPEVFTRDSTDFVIFSVVKVD